MSSKADNEKLKLIQDKCQTILGNLLREEDNKYCVDCDAKGPRWASWNLGIFLCIRCAGIHRNLGVHISKVRSVNLDAWTAEQVACLQQMGNSQARAVYEANLPENFRRPQTDSSLEAFIRAKYEQKKYIAKEWVPPPAPKPAFDIEEEKRKEREKKKKSKSHNVIEIPSLPQHPTALPRPHSTGPHSPLAIPVQIETSKSVVEQVPGSVDLLNLGDENNSSDDTIFDDFLSAPLNITSEKTQTIETNAGNSCSVKNISSEEADFFNQASGETAASRLTKESILSLYGTNPCQMPTAQNMTPVYGVPGGMFVSQQAYAQVGLSGYSAVPTQGISTAPGPNMTGVYNPFASLGPTMRPDVRQQPSMWIGVTPGGGDESLLMAHGLGQVTQQMTNLQLGQTWNVGGNPAQANASGLVMGSNQTPSAVVWPPVPSSQTNQGGPKNLWPPS